MWYICMRPQGGMQVFPGAHACVPLGILCKVRVPSLESPSEGMWIFNAHRNIVFARL